MGIGTMMVIRRKPDGTTCSVNDGGAWFQKHTVDDFHRTWLSYIAAATADWRTDPRATEVKSLVSIRVLRVPTTLKIRIADAGSSSILAIGGPLEHRSDKGQPWLIQAPAALHGDRPGDVKFSGIGFAFGLHKATFRLL